MNLSTRDEERVWAYVHREMDEAECAEFERDVSLRRELADAVREIRQIDGQLRELTPLAEDDAYEDNVARRLLAAIERDQAQGAPRDERANTVSDGRSPRAIQRRRRSWWIPLGSAAAVAASVLILVGLTSHLGGALRWLPVDYGSAGALRGREDRGVESAYSRGDLKVFAESLKVVIEEGYGMAAADGEEQTPRRARREWDLRLRFQQFSEGAFEVAVEAYRPGRDREIIARWQASYDSGTAFRDQVGVFGARVAEELARLKSGG
ncbi:MAG: hypothetical protein JXB04_12890 [Kiritimatiellae bacterium]|nr:hypothetical protein [Kiritimatiellia bacterium]